MIKKGRLFCFFFLFSLLFSVFPCQSFAQNTLPAGGEAIVAATPLSLGEYGNYSLPDGESVFYLIDEEVLPGQEIRAKVLFSGETNLGIYFYDQDYQVLTYKEYLGPNDDLSFYWPNGSQEEQKYYLQIKNQAINKATLDLVSIEVVDRFDAKSQTDAGNTLNSALPVELGQHTGFLDFNYDAQDGEDFYQVNLSRGQNLTVKATPPRGLYLDLVIYDDNGDEVASDNPQGSGVAAETSIKAEKNGPFYVAVAVGDYNADQSGASQYQLSLSSDLPDEGKTATANTDDNDEGFLPVKPFLGKIGGLVVLILITVLVIIGVTIFLLTRKDKEKQPDDGKKEPLKEEPKTKEEAVYCSACGTKNNPESKFCSKCGQELS
ncbi:MAG: zinc-ribbon domain-containing protein [Patescibacteria group bacterium]|jgi:hypothetical protein